jgi:hypothetical protein
LEPGNIFYFKRQNLAEGLKSRIFH